MNGARVPRGPAAVLAALHMAEPRPDLLASLTEREWQQALDFSNHSQLTLALSAVAPERTARDLLNNGERLIRARQLYHSLAACLQGAGVEYLALKGLSQCPEFISRPEIRPQHDIDLFVPREQVMAAARAIETLGFEPLEDMERFPTDHLPALIRKTGWEWRGDYYDPEMPLAVELHFRFWNEQVEKLAVPDAAEFWNRRVTRSVAGISMAALAPADAVGYTGLHLLRHLLRGSERPFHVYELACFLESHTADQEFWSEWRALHSPAFRRLQAVTFRLAAEWFGCSLSPLARQEVEQLPPATQAWFDEFGTSTADRLSSASKPELWLHLSLLESRRDAWSVARRRLLPFSMPGPVDAIHIPESEMQWHRRALKELRYAAYVGTRLRHHAASLFPTMWCGAVWWWKTNRLGSQFWTFLAAAVLYNFALFIFVLLYNLHLLDLGFRENFLGVVSSAGTVGCLLGTLPAAAVVRRFGLRSSLAGTIAGTALISAVRAVVVSRTGLAGLAFVNGVVFSIWAILIAPTIAGAVEEDRRPTAFSFFFATMFAVGIAGGWVGGKMPLWVHGKQPALLLASALAALALWPALRLRPTPPAPEGTKIYPRDPFLLRYLVPFALWNLATGSFNPFFNAYFARLRFPVERIGLIFSGSQMTQVVAVLLAPLVFRRAGLVTGIVWMMAATACGLGTLAAQPAAAALPYVAYMAFQWMSEPGLNTLLMNQVAERERGGASALNLLVAFSAQALAAWGAGTLLSRFGYGAVLAGAAGLALVSAALFQILLGHRNSESRAPAANTEAAASSS